MMEAASTSETLVNIYQIVFCLYVVVGLITAAV
jgi:hypothetical protein